MNRYRLRNLLALPEATVPDYLCPVNIGTGLAVWSPSTHGCSICKHCGFWHPSSASGARSPFRYAQADKLTFISKRGVQLFEDGELSKRKIMIVVETRVYAGNFILI